MKNLFFILLFIPLSLYSQNQAGYERTNSDTLPEKFKFDIPDLRAHIYSGIPSYYKKGKYERMVYKFADQQALNISEFISDGDVYSDWENLESYVNKILFKVLPPELTQDSMIHAYIYKDGNLNAFMTSSGQFFINIGMISACNDEATLAAIIAHEVAHYYKKHSLKGFIQREIGNFSDGLFAENHAKYTFSINNELEADSLSMVWLKNSNYNLSGSIKSERILQRNESKIISRSENKWKLKETSHPSSFKRVENSHNFYKKNKDYKGELFLVSKDDFFKFKEQSKIESLKFLLHDFQYYSCLELSFKFHLMDPDNQTYIYYLMESIRRICYTNSSLWDENFITNRYYDTIRVNGVRKKKKVKRGIFEKIDFSLLPITQEDAKYIKAKFYWQGEIKFKTYSEAFEFYSKVGNVVNCNECILSNALSRTRNKELRDKLLKEYLSKPKIKYKNYADNLLKGTTNKKLRKKKLLVFNDFDTYVILGKEPIFIRELKTDSVNVISNIYDSVITAFPDRELLYLQGLKNENLNEYKLFLELEKFSFTYITSKGEKTKLHILDPRYIELFYKYNVNEIEFINCSYSESRKSDYSVEAYKEIIETSQEELFTSTKRTKFLQIIITSLREIDNRRMKIKYYGGDNSIKFKEESYNEIIRLIKNKIRDKEKKAYDADVRYQKGWY